MQLYHGRISTQTFNSSIKFSQRQIYTKWGTIGSSVFISR
jgi:ribosomal protein S3